MKEYKIETNRISDYIKQNDNRAFKILAFTIIAILLLGLQLSIIGQVSESAFDGVKSNESSSLVAEKLEGDTSNSSTPPEFPGGAAGLFRYLSKKTKYPKELKNSGVKGMVYVVFQIAETGEIPTDSIRITQGVHPLLDEEAIKAISKMPKWKPAIDHHGDPVKSWYKLPVRFM